MSIPQPAPSSGISNQTASSPAPQHALVLTEGGIVNGVVILSSDVGMFFVQLILVTVLSRVLGFGIKYMKQPRVIAEVLSGIILGPSALGRIPGFLETLFPKPRMNIMSIVANVGLVLFLFIIGLELDLSILKKDFKRSVLISVSGMVFPFAFGCINSFYLYHFFIEKNEHAPPFSSVLIFVGVATCITAIPILARILTETKLISLSVLPLYPQQLLMMLLHGVFCH
jgi:Kef-type K+ transport system membrane component KefB